MKKIELTQDKYAEIDDEDFDRLNNFDWYYVNAGTGYAVRNIKTDTGKTLLYMHRFIIDAPDEMDVDHIDGNTLNNTKSNLRLCSHGENMKNRKLGKNNKSGYKGVYRKKNKWCALVRHNGKRIFVGLFDDVEEAARAYDKTVLELHGEYATVNFK